MLRFAGDHRFFPFETPSFVSPSSPDNPVRQRIPVHRIPREPEHLPMFGPPARHFCNAAPLVDAADRYALEGLWWLYQQADLTADHLAAFRAMSEGACQYINALGQVGHLRALIIGPDRTRWALFSGLADHLRANGASAEDVAAAEALATDATARARLFTRT